MGTRERFTKEFKLEAVRLLELGQKPAAQLALELGVRGVRKNWGQSELARRIAGTQYLTDTVAPKRRLSAYLSRHNNTQ
jgi:transposase-like protein